jgi:hypothetical protein
MKKRQRKASPAASELVDRVEALTEQFIDVRAEERRLVLTLERLRRVKAQLVAELATCAAEATEASVRERLGDA